MPTGGPAKGLSIFFPAYNDSGTIASLVITALRTARKLTPDHEVIVVNDGSKDNTAEILDELARTYSEVRVVHHEKNRGYGGALRTGFASATRELVFYTDGDAQYDPAEMAVLWRRFDDDVDLVNGYKISRSDPMHRIVIGRVYHHTVKLLFGLTVRDVDCDFRHDAAVDFRHGDAREEQRRDLPRDDEEDHRRRVPHRRGAGASLPPRLRQVAVLQLPAPRPHRPRRLQAVVRTGRPARHEARSDAATRMPADYRDFYRGRRVLVTGGIGFIGSNLARQLVDLGANVLLVDSMIPDYGGNLFNIAGIEDRVRVNIADVRQRQRRWTSWCASSEIIFNLAGQVSHIDSMRDPFTDLDINCRAQLSMLEACRQLQPVGQGDLRGHAAGLRQARPLAGRRDRTSCARSTSTASTRPPASITTCSTTTPSACARARSA